MARRTVGWFALLLVTLALSGCTDDAAPADGGSEAAPEPEEEGAFDGLLGHPAGIGLDPLQDPNEPGRLVGVVYAVDTGRVIADANVFATCIRAGLAPGFTEVARSDADGLFEYEDPAGLADCLQVTYEIQAPGFTLAVPLSSGPPEPGVATIVYGGLEEA